MRLVLWDIDGTLVDTAGHGRGAFATAYEAVFGEAPTQTEVFMAGRTDPDIAAELLSLNGIDDHDRHLPALLDGLHTALDALSNRISSEGRALPGVPAAVAALGDRADVIQGLLTGNIERNAHVKLAAFGLDEHLDLAVGGYGSDHSVRAELVGFARERAAAVHGTDVAAADTVLIGDTPRDVAAAHANGASAVGVATGPFTVAELRDAGADAVLEDLSDLRALLGALGLAP